MKLYSAVASIAGMMLLTACATHAPQPAIYPGSSTGYLEYVNETQERHAISAVRCGAENQQTYVVLNAPETTARVEAGQSRRVELTVGCYTVFTGPDRMSTAGRQHSVQIQSSDQGLVQIRSNGQRRTITG